MSDDTSRANPKPPSVDRLSQAWRRVSDRKIVQWSVAYIALAYGLQHGVVLASESLEWPNEVARISILLLALGLPVVMTFAWYHGERASRRISGPELTIISILLVIGSFLFYVFARPSEQVAATPGVQQAGLAAARTAASDPHGAISVVVLPFTNLSDDKQQEFFSDGMTEEITTALAKIPDLRVVARESAFQFKAQNRDIQTIGQQLHATHFIEGSVRKVGDRVRISAQLVKADDGVNVWSDSYDRQLTDVFAIQEDIAHAIAASLRMPLGIKPGENLVSERAVSPAAHENYLRAKNLVRQRFSQPVAEAIKLLEDTVAREPGYAPAWGLLGTAYHFQLLTHPAVTSGTIDEARRIVVENLAKGQAAGERAIKLEPKNVDGNVALAQLQTDRGEWASGLDAYERVFALDPDQPEALQGYSINLAHLGYVKKALPVRDHLLAVEPFVPAFQTVTARLLFADGQTDAALAILMKLRPSTLLPQIYAAQGRMGDAADALAAIRSPDPNFQPMIETTVKLLRAGRSAALPNDSPDLSFLNWVYFYTGSAERYLSVFEREVTIGYTPSAGNGLEWAPAYTAIRKTERFKAYVRDAGMVGYWRAKGWPPQCHPIGTGDFACE